MPVHLDVDANRQILEDAGVASEIVDEAITCKVDFTGTDESSTTIVKYKYNDFAETTTIPDNGENFYPGLAADSPLHQDITLTTCTSTC